MQQELQTAARALQIVFVLACASAVARADVQRRTLLKISAPDQWGGVIYSGRFSPDGKLLAALISENNTTSFRLWDTRRAVQLSSWNLRYLNNFEFSPSGRTIAMISGGRQRRGIGYGFAVEVRDTRTGRLLRTLVPTGSIYSAFSALAWSSDGTQLAAGGGDGRIRVWNTRTGKQQVLPAPYSFIEDLEFSPNGRLLAAASGEAPDRTLIYLYTLSNERVQRARLTKEEAKTVTPTTLSLAFSGDGRRLFTRRYFDTSRTLKDGRRYGSRGLATVIYAIPSLSSVRNIKPLPGESFENAGRHVMLSRRSDRFAYAEADDMVESSAKTARVVKRHSLETDLDADENVLAFGFTPAGSLQWSTAAYTGTFCRISFWSTGR